MLPKAVLFDLDDTILSFDGVADCTWEKVCTDFVQKENPPFSYFELLEKINKTRRWYWSDPERHKNGRMDMIKARREIVKLAMEELDYHSTDIIHQTADEYSRLQEESICLFPNSIRTLEKLKESGVRMALITNGSSETQRKKINRFCLSGYFEFCLVEGEVGYGKPDVRVFALALAKLSLKAEEVWMVGDNLVWDVEAPQKVGIYSIWNDYRKRGLSLDSGIVPDRIIHDISELLVE